MFMPKLFSLSVLLRTKAERLSLDCRILLSLAPANPFLQHLFTHHSVLLPVFQPLSCDTFSLAPEPLHILIPLCRKMFCSPIHSSIFRPNIFFRESLLSLLLLL